MNDNEYMRRVRALEPRLWRVAQAMLWREADCADAVQEAVFRGWMKKGGLREDAWFETWLVRILINACKDALRRRARDPAPLDADVPRRKPSAKTCTCARPSNSCRRNTGCRSCCITWRATRCGTSPA